MFRCHLTHEGQIVWGDHLEASTLEEARAESFHLLQQRADLEPDGFEIWSGTKLLLIEETTLDSPALHVPFGALVFA
jgi:hypothetical protein